VTQAAGFVELRAPAKINLWLRVHAKRTDGYHELSTVMMALELSDTLRGRLVDEPGIQLKLSGPAVSPDIPDDDQNLVVRALRAVRDLVQEREGCAPAGMRVELEKFIPSQAGLGGGSSDAATAVRLAERLYGVDAGHAWRRRLLAQLGADCSFFHEMGSSGLARCDGFGERVLPWAGTASNWSVVLLVPELRCPTGRVFQHLHLIPDPEKGDFTETTLRGSLSELRKQLATDLEPAALAAVPELAAWRALLDDGGGKHFRMSGSGSTFFGLFENEESGRESLQHLEQAVRSKSLSLRASFLTQAKAGNQLWDIPDHS
jgi:4-diphosphocytidyl-2-C-methyl-D-erythritol kinase